MTWVKVCGVTNEKDASVAIEAGADALGFVIAPSSVRRIDLDRAAALMQSLPVLRILVTQDVDPASLIEAAKMTGADGVQPHGRRAAEAAAAGAAAGLFVLHPISVGPNGMEDGNEEAAPDFDRVPVGEVPLLDSAHPDLLGGTGETFDWSVIGTIDRRFVLAGGLGPDNVADAVRIVKPWGVDASSRLERAPGVKDPGKVADFVARAKGI